jgi:8-oxo-dGTP diphosphatase
VTDNDARFVVGAAGVIRDAAGRVLLIRTKRSGWELPGGRVERGEDLVTALVREIREETGCVATVGALASVSSHLGRPDELLIFTFQCTHTGGEPVAGDDSLDVGWFTSEDALRAVSHPSEHQRLRDGLEYAGEVRYHVYRTDSRAEAFD